MNYKSIVKRIGRSLGVEIGRYHPEAPLPPDMPPGFLEIYKRVRPYTLTSPERLFSLCGAVEYVWNNGIEGGIVECGVWKGGSMMAVAETLLGLGDTSRDLYLFDTFEGMTAPTANDVDISGETAGVLLGRSDRENAESIWCRATLDVVKSALDTTGYPGARIHYVRGMVEETVPRHAPERIAVLRLDTDWYESTRHEMEHLFPRLARGGVLIIDDYGHWQGARKAVDEYLAKHPTKILLHRIDYTCRAAVKAD